MFPCAVYDQDVCFQIQSSKVQHIMEILERAKSSYYLAFKDVCVKVNEGRSAVIVIYMLINSFPPTLIFLLTIQSLHHFPKEAWMNNYNLQIQANCDTMFHSILKRLKKVPFWLFALWAATRCCFVFVVTVWSHSPYSCDGSRGHRSVSAPSKKTHQQLGRKEFSKDGHASPSAVSHSMSHLDSFSVLLYSTTHGCSPSGVL